MVARNEIVAPEFFQGYILATSEPDVLTAIKRNSRRAKKFLQEIPRKKRDFAYAEGKWTIKEILQHVMDSERVFCYRALSFARKDHSPLPSFDEQNWAGAVRENTSARNWKGLLEEFKALRYSTELLFESFGEEELRSVGIASGQAINTLALGFITAGHLAHHINIIKERYL